MGNDDTNQPGPSTKQEGKKERSNDGFMDKAVAAVFQDLDNIAKDRIRDLNNHQASPATPPFFPPDYQHLKKTPLSAGS